MPSGVGQLCISGQGSSHHPTPALAHSTLHHSHRYLLTYLIQHHLCVLSGCRSLSFSPPPDYLHLSCHCVAKSCLGQDSATLSLSTTSPDTRKRKASSPYPTEGPLSTSTHLQDERPAKKITKKSPAGQLNPATLPATPTLTTTSMDSSDEVISVASSDGMMDDQDSDLSMGGFGTFLT